MLDKLHNSFDWIAGVQPPVGKSAAFYLTLDGLKVGTLSYKSDHWTFHYSDAFQRQNSVKPIMDFPVTDKEYRSERLWPFFLLRIPSLEQPSVKRLIEERGPGELNEATLLRMFGRRSVANPFELFPA
jgi:HipA-like protein